MDENIRKDFAYVAATAFDKGYRKGVNNTITLVCLSAGLYAVASYKVKKAKEKYNRTRIHYQVNR